MLRGDQPADLLGKYLIVEEQAVLVREMFTRYAAGGASIMGLTQWINAQGIPTKTGAAYWHTSTVSYILNNPVYKGLGIYGRYDCGHDETRLSRVNQDNGRPLKTTAYSRKADPATWITWPVPALVSEAVWEAVQARLAENKAKKGGNLRRVRMLAGHVFCPQCGNGLQVVVSSSKPGYEHDAQYMCGKHFKSLQNQARGACLPTRYNVPAVEQAVITALQDAAQRPEVIKKALAAYTQTLPADTNAQPKADAQHIAGQLSILEKKQAAAVQAQIAGIMAGADPAAYNAVFAEIAAQRTELEKQQATLENQQAKKDQQVPSPQAGKRAARQPVPNLPTILADLERVLSSPSVPGAEKRDALALVIGKVFPVIETSEDTGKRTKNGAARAGGARVEFLPGTFTEAVPHPSGTSQETIQRFRSCSATATCEQP